MPRSSKSRSASASTRQGLLRLSILLVGGPLVALVWLLLFRTGEAEPAPQRETVAAATRTETPAPPAHEPEPAAESAPKPTPAKQDVTASVSRHDTYDPAIHPHPITDDHRRIFRQNDFIGQIDGAILVKDAQGIRRLNAQYRREYPDDDERTRQAYDMIADCLEEKTPELVARARQFWETKRSSRARRDLRRICLE